MKALRKIIPETVVMGSAYLAILIAAIVSLSLGWTTAGSGAKVPDRWLFVPTLVFFGLCLCQAIFFLIRGGRAGYGQVALSVIKLLAAFAVEYPIDLALDPVWNIGSQEERIYLAMVILFLVGTVLAAASEIVGNLRLRKKEAGVDKRSA